MARTYRIKCSHCGEVTNSPTPRCAKCGTEIDLNAGGIIQLYRMGNFIGGAAGFGLYINEQPYGAIGNRETLLFPLPYGEYKFHVVCGMSRRCNDPVIRLTPQDRHICLKVHMVPGVFTNSFAVERADPSSMPAVD